MNIQVSNTNGQLRVVQNGNVRFYSLRTIKSVDSLCNTNNDYYLVINFIANDKENALNIFLKDVTNQVDWTNTSAGAETAKEDISVWMENVNIISGSVTIEAPLDFRTAEESVSVVLASNQAIVAVSPHIITSSGDSSTLIDVPVYSISFASNGTANALVTFDGGTSIVAIPTGTTVNMDAGGICNFYDKDLFGYDTDTNAGASLIITYNEVL